MDALYGYIVGNSHLSVVNAVLLALVFFLARQRWKDFLLDIECLQKSKREHEETFRKHGMEIEREK